MLIILEGPDGAGKSTLVQKIKDAYVRRPPKGATFWEYRSQLGGRTCGSKVMRSNTYGVMNDLKNGKLADGVLLVERFHAVSDEVYRGVFGGEPFLNPHEAAQIFSELGKRSDVRMVYCRPPVQAVIERGLRAAGDDTVDWLAEVEAKIRPLYSAYDQVMNRLAWHWGVPVVRYDFTDPACVRMVEGFLCAG